jgi:hypothetical protein
MNAFGISDSGLPCTTALLNATPNRTAAFLLHGRRLAANCMCWNSGAMFWLERMAGAAPVVPGGGLSFVKN